MWFPAHWRARWETSCCTSQVPGKTVSHITRKPVFFGGVATRKDSNRPAKLQRLVKSLEHLDSASSKWPAKLQRLR